MVQIAKNMEKKPEKFEGAVSKAGYGFYNIALLLIGGGCLMSVIMETMGMMFVIPVATCDLDLDLSSKSALASISFAGVVLSSHLWGFLADTKGRKKVLVISMTVGFISSFGSSLAPNKELFILLRFVNGFFIGGSSAVIYAYVGEFHNTRFRPKVVAWIATFVALANVVLPALSWIILPLDLDLEIFDMKIKSWRLLVLSFGSPSLLFAIGLLFLPESPKFLLAQGRKDEVLRILQRMYSVNRLKKGDDFPVSDILWEQLDGDGNAPKYGLFGTIWHQTAPLFQRPYLLKTILVCLLQFGTFVTSSGLFMWYPSIVNDLERQSDHAQICDAIHHHHDVSLECSDTVDEAVYTSSLIIGALLIVIYILSGFIINRVGPKNLLIIILAVTACSGIAAQNLTGNRYIKISTSIFLMSSAAVGIINTIVVELYPTQLRAMALAISLMAGRLGAAGGSHLIGIVIHKMCDLTFYLCGIDHLLLIIITILLPTSTKVTQLIQPIT